MHFPGRWVTWVILLLGLVFVAAGVSNLRTHEQTEAVACFALGGVLLALFAHQRREAREERAFLAWLSANAAALRAGAGASYRDQLITVNTPTRQLTLCASFLLVGFRLPSRVLIAGVDPIGARVAVYSLGTLLLGWWSLHGLFWTPAALFTNLRGGREGTVGALLGTPPR